MIVAESGCMIPIPPIPLNAPGFGRTYDVVDEDGEPVGSGVVFLESEFHIMRARTKVSCFEIKEGKATAPRKVLMDSWIMPPFGSLVYFFGWQNPDLTCIRVLVPGKSVARLTADGISPLPRTIEVEPTNETLERADLYRLWNTECNFMPWKGNDTPGRSTLEAYVAKRLHELGVQLPERIKTGWRWGHLFYGVLPVYSGKLSGHQVVRVLYQGEWIQLDDDSRWYVEPEDQQQAQSWEGTAIDIVPYMKEETLPRYYFRLIGTRNQIRVEFGIPHAEVVQQYCNAGGSSTGPIADLYRIRCECPD